MISGYQRHNFLTPIVQFLYDFFDIFWGEKEGFIIENWTNVWGLFVFRATVTRICFPVLPNEWLLFPPYSLLYVVLLLPKLLPTFLSMVGDKLNCFQAKTPQCLFLWPLQVGLGRHSICTCWRSWILWPFLCTEYKGQTCSHFSYI